jgi:HK97 family phage major capsid protein
MALAADLGKELREKREAFVEFNKGLGEKATAEDFEKAQKMVADIEVLEEKYEKAANLEVQAKRAQEAIEAAKKAEKTPSNRPPMPGGGEEKERELQTKSIGQLFTESAAYKGSRGKHSNFSNYSVELEDVDYKATMTTTAGFAPSVQRTGRVVLTGFPRPVVADLMPNTPIDSGLNEYMRETTATNAADAIAEGALKPESTLVYAPVALLITTIATTLKVTNQQLDDVPQVRSLIDNRLTLFIELKEEDEILNGTGTAPHLQGLLTLAGTQAITQGASEKLQDAVARAIAAIQNLAFDEPSAVVINPTDWIAMATATNVQGIYYFPGGPTERPTMRLWGLPVISTPKIPVKKTAVGAFSTESELFRRMAVTIAVGLVNDDFAKNLQTIRAEERVGVAWYKPAAFSIVTGV